jgi:flagellar biosynthesis protein FliR
LVVPLLFTGILHSAIGIVSPILNQRIDWFWFVMSQVAFGLVCGYVVNLQAKVRTPQFQALPFAVRAGLHIAPDDHPQPDTHEDDRP